MFNIFQSSYSNTERESEKPWISGKMQNDFLCVFKLSFKPLLSETHWEEEELYYICLHLEARLDSDCSTNMKRKNRVKCFDWNVTTVEFQ